MTHTLDTYGGITPLDSDTLQTPVRMSGNP